MQSDKELEKSVIDADIINADGKAVVWAANFLGQKIPERVSGIDLMEELVKRSFEKGYKCFFFGAKDEVVTKLVDIYKKQYSNAIIAGYRNGYYDKSQEENIANKITASGANILFVAMTSPKKEIFLSTYKKQLQNINFIMGVGGSFDVIAGKVKRAPLWMQNSGLEWFYRVVQEPKRMWKRYLVGNTKFICLIIKEYFKSK
jgi:N-acetylglucosaminyldiphosphoundecaprenol N-acetyl-beta-D-mannosaminyltransferase